MLFRYSVEKDKSNKFIVVKYIGIIESSALYPVVVEAVETAKKFSIRQFLVDLTEARRKDSVVSDYHLAYSDLEKAGVKKTDLIVLLVDPEDHSHDFYETVLANAGYNVKLFLDHKQAEKHFTEK